MIANNAIKNTGVLVSAIWNQWSAFLSTVSQSCWAVAFVKKPEARLLIIWRKESCVLLDRKSHPSSFLSSTTSACPSYLIRPLLPSAAKCPPFLRLHLMCGISVRNLHDSGVREAMRGRWLCRLILLSPQRDRREWFPVLLLPFPLSKKIKSWIALKKKETPWDFTSFFTSIFHSCRVLPPSCLSCLILSE